MPVNGWGAAGTFGGSQPPIRTAAIDRLGSAPDPSRRCARRDAFAGSDAFTRAGSGFTDAGGIAPRMTPGFSEGGELCAQERTISAVVSRNFRGGMPVAVAGTMPKFDSTE